MRRAPARPVHACFVRSCCGVAQEHEPRATPVQCNPRRPFSSHLTLRSSHPALHTSHLHFTLHTSSHLKSCELISPHLSSSHLIPFLSTCHPSKFFSTALSHPSTDQLFSSPRSSFQLISALLHARAFTVRETSRAQKTLGTERFCTQKLETQMQ